MLDSDLLGWASLGEASLARRGQWVATVVSVHRGMGVHWVWSIGCSRLRSGWR